MNRKRPFKFIKIIPTRTKSRPNGTKCFEGGAVILNQKGFEPKTLEASSLTNFMVIATDIENPPSWKKFISSDENFTRRLGSSTEILLLRAPTHTHIHVYTCTHIYGEHVMQKARHFRSPLILYVRSARRGTARHGTARHCCGW